LEFLSNEGCLLLIHSKTRESIELVDGILCFAWRERFVLGWGVRNWLTISWELEGGFMGRVVGEMGVALGSDWTDWGGLDGGFYCGEFLDAGGFDGLG
jgi:hypothetical protein